MQPPPRRGAWSPGAIFRRRIDMDHDDVARSLARGVECGVVGEPQIAAQPDDDGFGLLHADGEPGTRSPFIRTGFAAGFARCGLTVSSPGERRSALRAAGAT